MVLSLRKAISFGLITAQSCPRVVLSLRKAAPCGLTRGRDLPPLPGAVGDLHPLRGGVMLRLDLSVAVCVRRILGLVASFPHKAVSFGLVTAQSCPVWSSHCAKLAHLVLSLRKAVSFGLVTAQGCLLWSCHCAKLPRLVFSLCKAASPVWSCYLQSNTLPALLASPRGL